MGQLGNWKMTPLDAMICSNQLQILKVLIFFFPPVRQKPLIFLVKLLELRQSLSLSPDLLASQYHPAPHSDWEPEMFDCIFPYCDQEQQRTFRQMQNAFQMMKTVQQFSDSGMFDHLSEMMDGMGRMDAFAQMAGMFNSDQAFSSGANPGSDQHTGGGHGSGFGQQQTDGHGSGQQSNDSHGFRQHQNDGHGSRQASANRENSTGSSGENRSDRQTDGSQNSDRLASMMASMMTPEQQELFAQYEAMLDE